MNNRFPFEKAKKVVLTGSSAGGMATYIWADHVKKLVGKNTEYYSIPDSSIFLDPQKPLLKNKDFSFRPKQNEIDADPTPSQVLLSISNKDENVPNSACAAALTK